MEPLDSVLGTGPGRTAVLTESWPGPAGPALGGLQVCFKLWAGRHAADDSDSGAVRAHDSDRPGPGVFQATVPRCVVGPCGSDMTP